MSGAKHYDPKPLFVLPGNCMSAFWAVVYGLVYLMGTFAGALLSGNLLADCFIWISFSYGQNWCGLTPTAGGRNGLVNWIGWICLSVWLRFPLGSSIKCPLCLRSDKCYCNIYAQIAAKRLSCNWSTSYVLYVHFPPCCCMLSLAGLKSQQKVKVQALQDGKPLVHVGRKTLSQQG